MSATQNSNIGLSGTPIEQSQQIVQSACEFTCLDLKPNSRDLQELTNSLRPSQQQPGVSYASSVSSSPSSPLASQNLSYTTLCHQSSLAFGGQSSSQGIRVNNQKQTASSSARGLKRPSEQEASLNPKVYTESLVCQQQGSARSVNLDSDALQHLNRIETEAQQNPVEPKQAKPTHCHQSIDSKSFATSTTTRIQEVEEPVGSNLEQGSAKGTEGEEEEDESSFDYEPVLSQILNEKKLVSMDDSLFCLPSSSDD